MVLDKDILRIFNSYPNHIFNQENLVYSRLVILTLKEKMKEDFNLSDNEFRNYLIDSFINLYQKNNDYYNFNNFLI